MRDNVFMKLAIEQLCRNVVVGAAAAAIAVVIAAE